MKATERERFDDLVDEVLSGLPSAVVDLFEEKPLVVEDRPSPAMLRDLGIPPEHRDEICGLHSGPMGPQRALDASGGGDPAAEIGVIHLFREGIVACAGGWEPWRERGEDGSEFEGGTIAGDAPSDRAWNGITCRRRLQRFWSQVLQ